LEAPVLAFVLAYLVRYFNIDEENSVGYLFMKNENAPAYMFMSVVVALFIGLTVSAEEIIKDRKIQKRESFLNLSKSSYLFSKIAIMFSLSAIQTLTYVIVGNSILGIQGMWIDYWLILFSTSCFANMLGLNISASFNSAVTIYILIPFLIIPQLLLSGVIVKFDKLNPTLAKQGGVPLSGEIMTSRWAYEALAVNQFKANEFGKLFYKYEKAISESEFKRVYWSEKITGKIQKLEKEIRENKFGNDYENDLALLRGELSKEGEQHKGKTKFKFIDQLFTGKVNLDILKELKIFINEGQLAGTLRTFYISLDKKAREEKNKLVNKLCATPEKKLAFQKLEEDFTNEALNQLLFNTNDLGERCLEKDGKLIQRINPIYLNPDDNLGRAHFYAPQKKLFGTYYPTFWFNLFVIWMMSLTLAITLYFDGLKKILDLISLLGRFLPKKKKK
jgi:hypothetical protein